MPNCSRSSGCQGNARLATLYTTHAPGAIRVALRYTTAKAAAEDVTHDAFLKLLNAYHRRGYCALPDDDLRRILFRGVVNKAIDYLRRQRRDEPL